MNKTIFDKLADQFDEVFPKVLAIEKTLAEIEPGGSLGDIVAKSKRHGDVYMAYTETPLGLAMERDGKRYIFRVMDV